MFKRTEPPTFNEGDDYEQWKRYVKMWRLMSDVTNDLHAVSVHMSLTGQRMLRLRSLMTRLFTLRVWTKLLGSCIEFISETKTGESSMHISTLKNITEQMVLLQMSK